MENITKEEIFKSYDIEKTGKKYCHKLKYEWRGTYDPIGKILEEIELRDYKYSKHGHKVFVTSIRYECDCTGVREIPYEYELYEYKYHWGFWKE